MAQEASRLLTGRRMITTDTDEITSDNVVTELQQALNTHNINSGEIDYLYKYYKGSQPILGREKTVRPEINNRIVVNRANEIVTFKTAYQVGEPIQYVCRTNDEEMAKQVTKLNEYMFAESKASKDQRLAEWFFICGCAYRMVLPDKRIQQFEDDAPFEIFTLDPRFTFVVYHSGIGNKPKMAVKYVKKANGDTVYSVYTDSMYFEIVNDILKKAEPHSIGAIPIIEYDANNARLGAFEIVLPLLNSINKVASNRLDGVEQFVQSLLVLKGVDIEAEEFKNLSEAGGLKLPLDGVAEYLTQELNQTQTQTLTDDMYQTVLTICGMPNRNGGMSTSDTGAAVIMRDGWTAAEARAKGVEDMFKPSEMEFMRICIGLSNTLRDMTLKPSAIDIRFTRRNYENIFEKAQVLEMMLSNPQIHPRLAFIHCGMFADPETAYMESRKHYEEENELNQIELNQLDKAENSVIMENSNTDKTKQETVSSTKKGDNRIGFDG